MAYCTTTDIQAEFKTLSFAPSSDQGLTIGQVNGFIDQASAIIDSQISNCFSLPISDTTENQSTLLMLKTVNVWLVADRIVPILQIKTRSNNLEQSGQNEITYYQKAMSLLNKICPASKTGFATPAKKDSSISVDYNSTQSGFFSEDVDQW